MAENRPADLTATPSTSADAKPGGGTAPVNSAAAAPAATTPAPVGQAIGGAGAQPTPAPIGGTKPAGNAAPPQQPNQKPPEPQKTVLVPASVTAATDKSAAQSAVEAAEAAAKTAQLAAEAAKIAASVSSGTPKKAVLLASGSPGGKLLIIGSGFRTSGTVKLAGVQIKTDAWSNTRIEGSLPADAKSGEIEVHVDDKTVLTGPFAATAQ